MKWKYALIEQAEQELEKFERKLRERIEKKLRYFFNADDPLKFAKPLTDEQPATHRFRIWKLRIKFFRKERIFYITKIEFRDKVYKRR